MPIKPGRTASEEAKAARAKAAARMRRSRERRKEGMRCFRLEIRDAEIAALVRRGYLAEENRANRAAVVKALYAFFDKTLGRTEDALNRVW